MRQHLPRATRPQDVQNPVDVLAHLRFRRPIMGQQRIQLLSLLFRYVGRISASCGDRPTLSRYLFLHNHFLTSHSNAMKALRAIKVFKSTLLSLKRRAGSTTE